MSKVVVHVLHEQTVARRFLLRVQWLVSISKAPSTSIGSAIEGGRRMGLGKIAPLLEHSRFRQLSEEGELCAKSRTSRKNEAIVNASSVRSSPDLMAVAEK